MSGSVNGTAALISSQYPHALYLHCVSHCLNLAVVKSLDEASVRNMIGVVNRVSIFFSAHPKRQRKLEEAIDQTHAGSAGGSMCSIDSRLYILPLFVLKTSQPKGQVVGHLMHSQMPAHPYLPSVQLSALVITSTSLNYLLALTCSLQSEAKDILQAVSEVSNLKTVLQDLRDNVDKYHDECFREIERMCTAVGTEPSLPRLCTGQTHCSNVPAQTPKEYYRHTITIPLLHHMLSEMDCRFNTHQQRAVTGLCLVPSILITKTLGEATSTLMKLGDMYTDDLPSPSSLNSEIHTWYLKWKKQSDDHGEESLPTTLLFSSPHASSLFPNIKVLLLILCTLPVSSCSAEQSFSGLKRIKTPLRSTMSNERLTSLTLLHLHRDTDIDTPEILDEFARRHPRRMELTNKIPPAPYQLASVYRCS